MKSSKVDKLNDYFLLFMIYSICGYLTEIFLEIYVRNRVVDRGFLFGPYCPIYGLGILLLYFILKKIRKKEIKIGKINLDMIITFIIVFIVSTLLEYGISYISELLFNRRWWDYSHKIFNINGRVCLETSLLFAIFGTPTVVAIHPKLEYIVERFDKKLKKNIAKFFEIILIIDFIISIIYNIIK